MKLFIGSVLLIDTDDGSGDSISGIAPSIERAVQVVNGVDAPEVSTLYRGNKKTSLSFAISRQHSSVEDAITFLFRHEAGLPNSASGAANSILIIQPDSSDATNSIKIAGDLTKLSSSMIGVRTTYRYEFVGGEPYIPLTTESGDQVTTESGSPISVDP